MSDIVRVLRILEYTGPREAIEELVSRSIQGERRFQGITMRAATIGGYPEILERQAELGKGSTDETL